MLRHVGCLLLGLALPLSCADTTSSDKLENEAGTSGEGGANAGAAGHPDTATGGSGLDGGAGQELGGNAGQAQGGNGGQHLGGNAGQDPGGNAGQGQGGSAQAGESGAAGAGGEGGVAQPQPPNRVFVTSTAYLPAQLGGISGADIKCSEVAAQAGMGGSFIAWLSSSQVDARDRLGSASGWLNTREYPFADQQAELLTQGQVYYPIAYDESGLPVTGKVATGTTASGTAAAENCDDWSSSAADTALVSGELSAGSLLWTEDDDGSPCSEPYHIYCFQIDHHAELYPTPSQGRTVFVSSQPFALGPSGRAAADALCTEDASQEGYQGQYVALLGTSSESALARLVTPSRPWVRPDGMVIASSTASITGQLAVAITEQADGTHLGGALVFGSDDLADPVDLNCEDWTNPAASVPAVIQGKTGYTDERWYAAQTGACSEPAHVLCVEK